MGCNERVCNILVVVFATIAVATLVAVFGLSYYYIGYMPNVPHSEIGLVCEFNVHGTISYISNFHEKLFNYTFYGSSFFALLAIVIKYRRAIFMKYKGNKTT